MMLKCLYPNFWKNEESNFFYIFILIVALFIFWIILKKCIEKKVGNQATSEVFKKIEEKAIDKVEEKV